MRIKPSITVQGASINKNNQKNKSIGTYLGAFEKVITIFI